MDETRPILDEKCPTPDQTSPTMDETSAIQAHQMRGENTGNGNANPSEGGIWRRPWALPLFVAQPAPIDCAGNNDRPASIEWKQASLLFEPARTKGNTYTNTHIGLHSLRAYCAHCTLTPCLLCALYTNPSSFLLHSVCLSQSLCPSSLTKGRGTAKKGREGKRKRSSQREGRTTGRERHRGRWMLPSATKSINQNGFQSQSKRLTAEQAPQCD
jgi:hypothetical protein